MPIGLKKIHIPTKRIGVDSGHARDICIRGKNSIQQLALKNQLGAIQRELSKGINPNRGGSGHQQICDITVLIRHKALGKCPLLCTRLLQTRYTNSDEREMVANIECTWPGISIVRGHALI